MERATVATDTKKRTSKAAKTLRDSNATKAAKTQAARLLAKREKIASSSKAASKKVPLTKKK